MTIVILIGLKLDGYAIHDNMLEQVETKMYIHFTKQIKGRLVDVYYHNIHNICLALKRK